jgi:hypothetical protein
VILTRTVAIHGQIEFLRHPISLLRCEHHWDRTSPLIKEISHSLAYYIFM